MKIYIAAPWANKAQACFVRDYLQALGHAVTARWLDATGDGLPEDAELCRGEAAKDLADIDIADTVLVLTDPRPIGVGHHVEIGYAIARRKRVVVAGPIKSIFHHLGEHFASWEEAKAAL